MEEEEKQWCYNCHWYRDQAGSSHGLCPVSVDIGYGHENCKYWKKQEGDRPDCNQFMVWSGKEDPWPDWEQWVQELKAKGVI